MSPITPSTASTTALLNIHQVQKVIVHPLVLLSVTDHYHRLSTSGRKRVVGVLLGQNIGGVINVANCFAVPFEEDEKDQSVWFLDHNYIESMNNMYKKVNAKEKMIGWYHTGPKLRSSDLEINGLFKKYLPHPILVIVDVRPKKVGIPTDAYFAIEEIKDDGSSTSRTFVHAPSIIEAEEAEEIGVEHLLRDIRDAAVGTLATRITSQLHSLQGLHSRLLDIATYLEKVVSGKLPVNHEILGYLQDVFNLLPNLATGEGELNKSLKVTTNDQFMCVYLSSLIRATIALHDLIENKISNREGAEKMEEEKVETKE